MVLEQHWRGSAFNCLLTGEAAPSAACSLERQCLQVPILAVYGEQTLMVERRRRLVRYIGRFSGCMFTECQGEDLGNLLL